MKSLDHICLTTNKLRKKDKVFRCGDLVRIINPKIFVRCGYPLSKEDIKRDYIKEDQKDLIKNLISSFSFGLSQDKDRETYDKILDILAYRILEKEGFGGNKRDIITRTDESKLNKVYKVFRKRFVKTGVRTCWGLNYHSEGYEAPYLSNEKTRIILGLGHIDDYYFDFEIEACNLEKISDDYEIKNEDIEAPF